MASLTGKLVADTYRALLKTIDNDILIASEKQITDGLGGGSGVFIDSQGFLRANKFIVTNGTASQFLKGNGTLDGNTYLTGITSSQVTMALGYTPVTNQRILTINNVSYDLSQNRTWTLDSGGGTWGDIVGTLSNQTDLQAALDAKYDNPTGTILDYIRGDGSIAPFTNSASQTKNEVKLGAALATGTPVYVSSANGTNMIVSASSNTTEATSSKTLGLLETGGALNDIVECVTFGLIDGLDTSAASAGDPVWLGPNGTLLYGLANKPYAPAHMVYIGVVTRAQSNNGEIFVNVQNGFELDELHNVDARTPSNNEGIFYETSTSLWKNKTIDDALGYTPQRLDKMVSNLLASDTEYPNSNAVIAKLNLKANIENPEFTGSMNITGIESRINFYDQYSTRKFFIGYNTGTLTIYQDTGSAARFYINSSGKTFIPGDLEIGSISKSGGTSSQFFKADGSIDSTAYAPTSTLSNYLLVTTAASTYQRIDKMVSNLLASDTEYPNSNAVLAKLALKADAENPSFTGFMTIGGSYPKIYLTDSDNNPDYFIGNDDGYFRIYDQTNTVSRFYITSSGASVFPGDVTVGSIAKSGGTSSQFLKADGSIDSSSYVSSATLANYLLISTATSTYQRLDKMVSNLLASDTEYPNSNAVLAKLALKADAADPVFTGNLTISGIAPKLFFTDTDNNPDYTIFVDSGYFYIYDQTAGATKFQITPSGNAINTGTMTASSFIKAGGTSSQYLMADGSVTTGGGITGSGTTNYISKWSSSSALNNSAIYDLSGKVGIGTTNPQQVLELKISGGTIPTLGTNPSNGNLMLSNNGLWGMYFGLDGASGYGWIQQMRNDSAVAYSLLLNPVGGNVAIGTTNSAWYQFTSLDIGSNVSLANYVNYTMLGTNVYYASSGNWTFKNTGYANAIFLRKNDGTISFATFGTGTGGTTASGVDRLTITNGGSLLVNGTNDLWVGSTNRGVVHINGAVDAILGMTIGGTNSAYIYHSGSTLYFKNTKNGSNMIVGNEANGSVEFVSNNVERMRITNAGQVLIGQTVASGSTNGVYIRPGIESGFIVTNDVALQLSRFGSTGDLLTFYTASTRVGKIVVGGSYVNLESANNGGLTINSSGNVSIGSTSDNGNKLQVNGSASFNGKIIVGSFPNSTVNGGEAWIGRAADRQVGILTVQLGNNNNSRFEIVDYGWTAVLFSVSGSGSVTGSAFFESSDIRLKTLIDGSAQIAGIENLEAKLYEKNGKVEFGYFAQEAEKLMPYAVTKGADGFLNLSYREVHTAKIARLEKRVAELEKQLNLN